MNSLSEFIKTELLKRRNDYLTSPAYILEHYNIERQNVEAYNGRQLLEMLQNADDASEKTTQKTVLIKLANNELLIANNGIPFDENGFRSIIYSNLSHKTMLQNKIGQKGLGFRSLLSWSNDILINSGGVELGFSEINAVSFLTELMDESAEVRAFIKQNSKAEFPISILRVPKLLNVVKNHEPGFDTAITVKLKESILEDVQSQINNIISKETLIFLNNIETIEIDSPQTKIIYTKEYANNEKNTVTVRSYNVFSELSGSKTWHINRRAGIHQGKNYELAIAWNDELNDQEDFLFSYFKTKTRFPFPALLHGTFELSQNRNYLENDTNGHNKFLIDTLANLLIETSLQIASKTKQASYLPLKLLNIDFEKADSMLAVFKFKETLLQKIRENRVFPSVNGAYFDHSRRPVYYDNPVANILKGNDVDVLMPHITDTSVTNFLRVLGLHYFRAKPFISIIARRVGYLPNTQIAKLINHLLTYSSNVNELNAQEFILQDVSPFLPDADNRLIPWNTHIFVQPGNEKAFKLPKGLNVHFINQELIACLLKEFGNNDITSLVKRLSPFHVKEYSFAEIAETLIKHYSQKQFSSIHAVKECHYYLYQLYRREYKINVPQHLPNELHTPVITLSGKIKSSKDVYLGSYYGHKLSENLYSFDKSKILAEPEAFNLRGSDTGIINSYFQWLGVAQLPRYKLVELTPESDGFENFKEHLLRNYDYRKPNDWGESYKNYTHLSSELSYVPKITVGCFDDLKRVLQKVKPEIIFEWIKLDDRLRKTLEEDSEILQNSQAALAIKSKQYLRYIKKSNLRSYTRWTFATTVWLPVDSTIRKAMPDKCCLSKTITQDFSPFVEKAKINLAGIADKLDLPEAVIENYLLLVGVHREISSFSVESLYEVLSSLPRLDKDGKVARKIYREIISNFNENKIDEEHKAYKSFLSEGRIFCQKGNSLGYFKIEESYYIPTKTYGSNILKKFPLAAIDSKQGAQKVERLFGVKRLKDITFDILGEPLVHACNDVFQNEIERFKALVYLLRKDKDTRHEIANRLKKLKIFLCQEVQTKFTHTGKSEAFELEAFEYIHLSKRNQFYISVPTSSVSLDDLRESNRFCQSIAEIFSILIETEEYNDFIHDLYSKPEISREPRLINYIQASDNADIIESRRQLNVIDDMELSFWRAFIISSGKQLKTDVRSREELLRFFRRYLKVDTETFEKISAGDFVNGLFELNTLEVVYKIFVDYKVDYNVFSRHFSGLRFFDLFKNKIEDLKIAYRTEFSFRLYVHLESSNIYAKEKYFDQYDDYNSLQYHNDTGFLADIHTAFIQMVYNEFSINLKGGQINFSIEESISHALITLSLKEVVIPDVLKERRVVQAYLLFGEEEALIKLVEEHKQLQKNNATSASGKQVNVAGTMIDYNNYESLAEQVLQGLAMDSIKIKMSKTSAVDEKEGDSKRSRSKGKSRNVRFDTKNEEVIGFITELVCYHKLIGKYGEDSVKWVSENAYRAYPNRFLTSEAGKGYDFELTEQERVRFVEVKGTSNINEGIFMTKEEIRVALNFPERYDLLILEDPLSEDPRLRYIKSPFKFRKDDSLFKNDKLKVFNDRYVIKFKWDE
jgi:hypothetical protein